MDRSWGLPSGMTRVLRGAAEKLEWGGMASRILSWYLGGRAEDTCPGKKRDEGAWFGIAVERGRAGELSSRVHRGGSTYASDSGGRPAAILLLEVDKASFAPPLSSQAPSARRSAGASARRPVQPSPRRCLHRLRGGGQSTGAQKFRREARAQAARDPASPSA